MMLILANIFLWLVAGAVAVCLFLNAAAIPLGALLLMAICSCVFAVAEFVRLHAVFLAICFFLAIFIRIVFHHRKTDENN